MALKITGKLTRPKAHIVEEKKEGGSRSRFCRVGRRSESGCRGEQA